MTLISLQISKCVEYQINGIILGISFSNLFPGIRDCQNEWLILIFIIIILDVML